MLTNAATITGASNGRISPKGRHFELIALLGSERRHQGGGRSGGLLYGSGSSTDNVANVAPSPSPPRCSAPIPRVADCPARGSSKELHGVSTRITTDLKRLCDTGVPARQPPIPPRPSTSTPRVSTSSR